MQAFKQPLTSSKEAEYLERAKSGDKDARNILVEYNLRLVAHIVKKYCSPNRNIEDLISIGTIGLIKAIDTYDASKGNRLVTYASRCIENELLMRLRQEKKEQREISMYEPIGTDKEGNEICLIDVISTGDECISKSIIANENLSHLSVAFNSFLSPREKEIVILRYGLGGTISYTQQDVADKLMISRSYVSRIEKKALQKLRNALDS